MSQVRDFEVSLTNTISINLFIVDKDLLEPQEEEVYEISENGPEDNLLETEDYPNIPNDNKFWKKFSKMVRRIN